MFVFLSLLQLGVSSMAPSSFANEFVAPKGYSQLQIDELMSMTDSNKFPKTTIMPYDPLSKEKVDNVLVGPTFPAASGAGFDYYRYVTFYNIDLRKERISSLPIHREECWDKSEVFASYSYAYTFTATVTASETVEGLGLSASLSKSQTLTAGQNVVAVGGIQADHIPYLLKQDWSGRTFIQTYKVSNHKVAFILEQEKSSPWWISFFFPVLAQSEYPMDFEVKNADWTFDVERNILKHCSPNVDDGSGPLKAEIITKMKHQSNSGN